MVFIATLNNISVTLWRSVLLVNEPGSSNITNIFNEEIDVSVAISMYYLETFTQMGYTRKRGEARTKTCFVHRQTGDGQ